MLYLTIFAELIFTLCFIIVFYKIFISDWLEKTRNDNKKFVLEKANANKLAKVKLVSDDAKDIEKFIENNAQYLSEDVICKLVDRIEIVKDINLYYESEEDKSTNNKKQSL